MKNNVFSISFVVSFYHSNTSITCIYIMVILHQSTILFLQFLLSKLFSERDGLVSNKQAEVVVDASMVRSGRNVTVIAVEFKMKKTSKLIYIGRATFYNMPIAKL